MYIETKIRYEKMQENGTTKKVNEPYLVDALSFTEAEARIVKEVTPYISGDFTVSAVKKTNIAEIFRDESGDKWYKCKLNFITINETSGCEKRVANYILVQARDFHHALENVEKCMKGTMADYEIAAITETKIWDVYGFEPATDKNNNE